MNIDFDQWCKDAKTMLDILRCASAAFAGMASAQAPHNIEVPAWMAPSVIDCLALDDSPEHNIENISPKTVLITVYGRTFAFISELASISCDGVVLEITSVKVRDRLQSWRERAPKFYVSCPGMSAPTAVHLTMETAWTEAERLCRKNNAKVQVFQLVGEVVPRVECSRITK